MHESIAAAFPEVKPKERRIRDLDALLRALGEAQDLRRRIEALEKLARWVVRRDAKVPDAIAAVRTIPSDYKRVGMLVHALERMPSAAAATRAALSETIAESHALGLLAETGVPSDRGIASELVERVLARVLPRPRDDEDLARLAERLLPGRRELAWIEALPAELFERLGACLGAGAPGSPFAAWRDAAGEAFTLLGARIEALGLSPAIRVRASSPTVRGSPFFQLARAGDDWIASVSDREREPATRRAWQEAAARARDEAATVTSHLEARGISLEVVYGLEVFEHALARMELLVEVLAAPPGASRLGAAQRLLAVLVRARFGENSLRELARTNLRLLARKLIERAGETGEHYIAHGRRAYWLLFLSGCGGGLLTVGTASGKIAVSAAHLAPFLEGLLAGINYALSFILIQLLHFTLATKQPSMTGAHLAGMIGGAWNEARIDRIVSYVARICRSQLAAAVGNVGAVAAGAFGLALAWRTHTGQPFLGAEKATSVVASFDPLTSGTAWFAFLTGVILWMASVCGGWIENFFVVHRVPQAIAEHRAGRWLGERTLQWVARFFAHNISGYGGSIALGLMLGLTPAFGTFFGLPLDVRHVTLSSGTLVLALASLEPEMLDPVAVARAAGGIALVFALNLGTSFTLALLVAMRARAVPAASKWRLLPALARRALRRPGEFLLPPPGDERAEDAEPAPR